MLIDKDVIYWTLLLGDSLVMKQILKRHRRLW